MRAFYEDQEISKHRYYIKLDNISAPDEYKGYVLIEASTPQELLENACSHYKFKQHSHVRFELWSNTKYNKGIRLDTLDRIPEEYEFIWLRATQTKSK